MKTAKFLFVVMAAAAAFTVKAQDYKSDMESLVTATQAEKPGYALLASQFGSLAEANPNEWEAGYYMAYCTIMQAYSEKGEAVDQLLDKAEPVVHALEVKMPNESELIVLEAMINQARIKVSPMSRGMKYSKIYAELLEKAIAMNPNNPRAYLIKGMGTINMPAMFGGGKKSALPIFQKAQEKFGSFVAPSTIYPSWGKALNEKMLAACSAE